MSENSKELYFDVPEDQCFSFYEFEENLCQCLDCKQWDIEHEDGNDDCEIGSNFEELLEQGLIHIICALNRKRIYDEFTNPDWCPARTMDLEEFFLEGKVLVTALSGVTLGDAQQNIILFGCRGVGYYALVREPDNQYDSNAIWVGIGNRYLGYIPKEISQHLAPLMDSGKKFLAYFNCLNESPNHSTVGLTVLIREDDEDQEGQSAAS